ncbi:MAG: FadR/GntR family transcriptional regulator [Leucobacter sp.]
MARTNAANSRAMDIAGDIQAEILTNRMEVGAHLGLRTELIERFGVSPGVMNEALQLLRERGLVSVKSGPKGGVYVAELPPQIRLGALDIWFQHLPIDPVDLFESRMYLEDMFSALAMERAGPQDIRAAEWALDEMHKLREDPAGLLGAKLRFHLTLARGSRLGMLGSFYDAILGVFNGGILHVSFVPDHEPLVDHTLQVHTETLDAIRAHDSARLYAAMKLNREEMIPFVDRLGGDLDPIDSAAWRR